MISGFILLSMFLVLAIFTSFIAPFDPWEPGRLFLPPGLEHPLGTNDIGQDIFRELVYATRISLKVLSFVLIGFELEEQEQSGLKSDQL